MTDTIRHHGIKGMRWGVRRERRKELRRERKAEEKRLKTEAQEAKLREAKLSGQSARSRMKPLDQISDAELSKLVARMDNEIRYNENAKKLYYSKKEKRKMITNKFIRDQARNGAKMASDKLVRDVVDTMFTKAGEKKSKS